MLFDVRVLTRLPHTYAESNSHSSIDILPADIHRAPIQSLSIMQGAAPGMASLAATVACAREGLTDGDARRLSSVRRTLSYSALAPASRQLGHRYASKACVGEKRL
jgi:hypothetical protein